MRLVWQEWPRPRVLHATLVNLRNLQHNCSLAVTRHYSKYPVRYQDGTGSSHQLVVGCDPDVELDRKEVLWQPVLTSLSDDQERTRNINCDE